MLQDRSRLNTTQSILLGLVIGAALFLAAFLFIITNLGDNLGVNIYIKNKSPYLLRASMTDLQRDPVTLPAHSKILAFEGITTGYSFEVTYLDDKTNKPLGKFTYVAQLQSIDGNEMTIEYPPSVSDTN